MMGVRRRVGGRQKRGWIWSSTGCRAGLEAAVPAWLLTPCGAGNQLCILTQDSRPGLRSVAPGGAEDPVLSSRLPPRVRMHRSFGVVCGGDYSAVSVEEVAEKQIPPCGRNDKGFGSVVNKSKQIPRLRRMIRKANHPAALGMTDKRLDPTQGSVYFLSVSASTPGSFFPSKNSKDAPPPVEMWVILSATPAAWTAATESPPPTIETAPTFSATA